MCLSGGRTQKEAQYLHNNAIRAIPYSNIFQCQSITKITFQAFIVPRLPRYRT